MSRYTGPRCRICRRFGEKLFLKGVKCYHNCPLDRRPNPPGKPPHFRRRRISPYGLGLMEKQKVRFLYGLTERQFRRYFEMAQRRGGVLGEELFKILESRLDRVLHRAGVSYSLPQVRQWVNHGHFLVNEQKVDIPSYLVEPGDEIRVKPGSPIEKEVKENLQRAQELGYPKDWLQVFPEQGRVLFLRYPARSEIQEPINDQLIIEFYTR